MCSANTPSAVASQTHDNVAQYYAMKYAVAQYYGMNLLR